jgi:hypothetical protein
MTAERCTATTKSGNHCAARAWKDGLCPWHHPDKIKEISAKGGRNSSTRARAIKRLRGPQAMADLRDVLMEAFVETREGKLDPKVLTALATGARAILDVSGVATYDDQISDLKRQLAELSERRGIA